MIDKSDFLHPHNQSHSKVQLEAQSRNPNGDVKPTEIKSSWADVTPDSDYLGNALENLELNTNWKEIAQQFNYISDLEAAGKLEPEEAYQQIKALWKQLKHTKKRLEIGEHPFEGEPVNNPEY